ncbi:hypothetical protein V8G54_035305 [Vigna mungo]|uniref:Uncharacterized protein n=1 Tax=Vigna mungo TaxID=3915 RepID=A0AAQ3MER8_VIGMU
MRSELAEVLGHNPDGYTERRLAIGRDNGGTIQKEKKNHIVKFIRHPLGERKAKKKIRRNHHSLLERALLGESSPIPPSPFSPAENNKGCEPEKERDNRSRPRPIQAELQKVSMAPSYLSRKLAASYA